MILWINCRFAQERFHSLETQHKITYFRIVIILATNIVALNNIDILNRNYREYFIIYSILLLILK